MRILLFMMVVIMTLTVNVSPVVMTEPMDSTEPMGTAPALVPREPSREDNRVLMMEATAYCWTGRQTRTGTWPSAGRTIAVDPRIIPLGTRVRLICDAWPHINGEYIAEDTGGLIRGYRIDVFLGSREECLQFGRRNVELYVVDVK